VRGAYPETRSLLQAAGAAHCWGSAVQAARALAAALANEANRAIRARGLRYCVDGTAHCARSERAERCAAAKARTVAEHGGGGGGAHDAPVRARAVRGPGQRARRQRVRGAVHRLPARPGPSTCPSSSVACDRGRVPALLYVKKQRRTNTTLSRHVRRNGLQNGPALHGRPCRLKQCRASCSCRVLHASSVRALHARGLADMQATGTGPQSRGRQGPAPHQYFAQCNTPPLKPAQGELRACWARRAGSTQGRRARSRPTRGPAGAGPRSRRRRGRRAARRPPPRARGAAPPPAARPPGRARAATPRRCAHVRLHQCRVFRVSSRFQHALERPAPHPAGGAAAAGDAGGAAQGAAQARRAAARGGARGRGRAAAAGAAGRAAVRRGFRRGRLQHAGQQLRRNQLEQRALQHAALRVALRRGARPGPVSARPGP